MKWFFCLLLKLPKKVIKWLEHKLDLHTKTTFHVKFQKKEHGQEWVKEINSCIDVI